MKVVVHQADSRGGADHGWLKTRHSFSFAQWHDPARMGFGALRVLNDDWIAPQSGFPPHYHENFEIVTIVRAGAVTHEDSLSAQAGGGSRGRVKAGEVQVMSAGTGVTHAEYNREDEPLELFQVWIESARRYIAPRYDQKEFDAKRRRNRLGLLVSGEENSESLLICQDARIFLSDMDAGKNLSYELPAGKGVYTFIVEGRAEVAGHVLSRRDAAGVSDTPEFSVSALEPTSALFIEVPLRSAW